MKGKTFPGFLAEVLHGMFGMAAVRTVLVIGKVRKQTIECCAIQVLEIWCDTVEQSMGLWYLKHKHTLNRMEYEHWTVLNCVKYCWQSQWLCLKQTEESTNRDSLFSIFLVDRKEKLAEKTLVRHKSFWAAVKEAAYRLWNCCPQESLTWENTSVVSAIWGSVGTEHCWACAEGWQGHDGINSYLSCSEHPDHTQEMFW